ncbi:hypothetical protein K2W90_05730 [Candidatus Babeliales bacterium]|nr:hypothetical protein [Candidatus Babeliales bacterium]
MLGSFGFPTMGSIWVWLMILAGIHIMVYSRSKSHEELVQAMFWVGLVLTVVGSWFLFGNIVMYLMPISFLKHFGTSGSWLLAFFGLTCLMYKKMSYYSAIFDSIFNYPLWFSSILSVVGAWFVVGDAGWLPTFDMSLAHVVIFLIPIGLLIRDRAVPKNGTEHFSSATQSHFSDDIN